MTVSQVGRTTNSVTINVSGITDGDRQTYVWIPVVGEWYTIQKAKEHGFVYDFYVADYTSNNGDITVVISSEYLEYKVVALYVKNINTSTEDKSVQLNAILDFEYENSFPKLTGADIDITVFDMQEINDFGSFINSWIDGGDGEYYPLEGVSKGDSIYYDYLLMPSQHILNAAYNQYCEDHLSVDDYDAITNHAYDIILDCVSGSDFKAQYFNGILYAIRNFNLSVTV